jgi:flagellar biosynthesis/type III secretory pathway protein FliH
MYHIKSPIQFSPAKKLSDIIDGVQRRSSEAFKQPLVSLKTYEQGVAEGKAQGYALGWADAMFRMKQEIDVLKNSPEGA